MRALLDGIQLDELAIKRIQTFAEQAVEMSLDGYWIGDSGGKDSEVIIDLVRRAGVPHTINHSLTTADAPETVRHIKENHPFTRIHRPELTMWQLIKKKGMPPRRNARYCCETQKEVGGAGHVVVLGLRWQESGGRSKRRMFEACYKGGRRYFLSPIIEWTTADVWQYICERGLKYNPLYDEGFKRVGCVLCPMTRDVARQMQRWPRLCRAWEKAVKATWNPDSDKRTKFNTPQEYWEWWLDRDRMLASDAGCLPFAGGMGDNK